MQLKPERWLDHGEKRNTAALLGEKSKTAPQCRLTSFVVDRIVTAKFGFSKLVGRVRMVREGTQDARERGPLALP